MPIYKHVRQNNSGRHSIVFHGHQPPSQYINAIIIVETPSFVNLNNPLIDSFDPATSSWPVQETTR